MPAIRVIHSPSTVPRLNMNEFELIRRFFRRDQAESPPKGLMLGIGDDAALLQPPAGMQLAVTTDTLVSGVHFPADANAEDIAERALRVNLSDLAAMGAEPLWFTLALTLPPTSGEADEELREDWLRDFSRGLFQAANEFDCALVGGDTTSGPLSICVQAMGSIAPGEALRRDGASAGDYVLVTHCLGDGAAGLAVIENRLSLDETHNEYLRQRYHRPEPRFKEATLLRGLASAALDISDGLAADLGHICAASDLAAQIDVQELPLSPALLAMVDLEQARRWALSGGDDYELCFTVPESKMPEVGMLIARGELKAKVVGQLMPGSGVQCLLEGEPFELEQTGYTHFQ